MFKFPGFSQYAHDVDQFTLALTLLCGFVCLVLFGLTAYFCWKYHASRGVKPQDVQAPRLEIFWTIATTVIFLGIFAWATVLYRQHAMPTEKVDHEIFVIGKRWMWKFYHANGFTEVNDLHLPVNKTIRLTMISQDVIHSMYLPGMRTKQDLLPGTYTTLVVRPNATGESSLYCAEYCGTEHARMKGVARVLPVTEYDSLLQSNSARVAGEEVFRTHKCMNCHDSSGKQAPALTDLKALSAQEIRTAVYAPNKEVKGDYPTPMPSYLKTLDEEQVLNLVQYIQQTRFE